MNDYPGAFVYLAFHFDGAVVFFDDFTYKVQAKPEPFDIMHIARRHPVEFLKNMFLMFPRDADTVIRNRNGYTLAVCSCCDCYLRYLRCIFEGIVDQIDQQTF